MLQKHRSRAWIQPFVMGVATLLALAVTPGDWRDPVTSASPPESEGAVAQDANTLSAEARAAGANESWWEAVSTQLAQAEYEPKHTETGLAAPNRAQNLRTTFGEGGIEVTPRTNKDEAPPWSFRWETSGIGREGAMLAAAAVAPTSADGRVMYHHDGWSEWYVNTAKGLEQGFTIERRPEGDGPLRITGIVPANLKPELREDGSIDFIESHGALAIRYGELHTWDANGVELHSELAVEGTEIALVIDDDGASYPLTIDPLMTSPAWTAEGNELYAGLGFSVGTAGDVNGDGFSDAIVCVNFMDNEAGWTLVYHGSAAGLAMVPAWSTHSAQDNFSVSAGAAGDVNGDGFDDVIVGIPEEDNGQTDEGRAHVFHGSSSGLSGSPVWTAEINQAFAGFGYSVGTAGDVNGDGFSDVIVGAWLYDNGDVNEGAAFVYHGSALGLGNSPAWTGEGNNQAANMGTSVATAGDVNADGYADIIVGAYRYTNGQGWEGRAFAYHGAPSGLSSAPAWFVESDQIGAELGSSVATAGDTDGDGYSDVIVGVHNFDNGQNNEGKASVYRGGPLGLAQSPAWEAELNAGGAQVGTCVGTAGDVNGDGYSDVIVGAAFYSNGQSGEGGVFLYMGPLSPGPPTSTLEGNQIGANFGWSAGTAGDVNGDGFSDVIVGALSYDNGEEDEGGAFVYHGGAETLAASHGWAADGSPGESFAVSLGTAGDVNGDGFSDFIVGGRLYSNGEDDEGRACVFHGSATGPSLVPDWTVESDQTYAYLGWSVSTAGDVNGDGYSDVIVGAPYYDNGESGEGRALIYHGSASGLSSTPARTIEGNQQDVHLGELVAAAGDVNGDGYSDVFVGLTPPQLGLRARLYYGSADGIAGSFVWNAFAESFTTAGDVNADGYSDVILGSPYAGDSREGLAFLYCGSANGLSSTPDWEQDGDDPNAYFGSSVGTAGDVNGDGYSDVIIGGMGYYNYMGRAFVFHGSATGLLTAPAWAGLGSVLSDFGTSVGTAGDVNGDGFSDVIVGAPYYGFDDEGASYLYHGSASGVSETPAWTVEGNIAFLHLGRNGGAAGDLNGDGFTDVILGLPGYDGGDGRAITYYGNGGDGIDRIPRQSRTDDTAPISLLGTSDSESSFLLKARGRIAAGRGRVQLQVEVKPLSTPFDGVGVVTGATMDTGVPTSGGSFVALSHLAIGLDPSTLYHWRLRTVSDSPLFPSSPWMSMPGNAPTESDVRTAGGVTGVEEIAATAAAASLAAFPNPFASTTRIAYTLPQGGRHRLAVYDVQGRLVSTLADGVAEQGRHVADWDGRDRSGSQLPSGVYFYRLEAGDKVESRKVVILR